MTAVVALCNNILVFDSNCLYVYNHSLAQPTPDSKFPFPLHSTDLLAVNQNLLLCTPSQNIISIYQFEFNHHDSTLNTPTLIAEWVIPEEYKISVACWASNTQQHVLLGTRDGAIFRLDLDNPGNLSFINIDGCLQFQSATVSSIAAAPCADGYYAIGYASGLVRICQDDPCPNNTFSVNNNNSNNLKTIHTIQLHRNIQALSWHYSCKDKTSQSLALLQHGSDRLQVYTVNVESGSVAPKKIRDVPLPHGQSIPSQCSRFLQWSKSGNVSRVSDHGIVVSDVRTKKVMSRSISLPPPVISIDINSPKGKAWTVDSAGVLRCFNLIDGSLQCSVYLDFFDDGTDKNATILDSPIVYIHRPLHVNAVVYKNKRALKSPSTPPSAVAAEVAMLASPEQQSKAALNQAPPTPKQSPKLLASRQTVTVPSRPSTTLVKLSLKPVKAVVDSLFPSVMKTLSRMPEKQTVPEFIPSLSSKEQYAISALFGGNFSTSLCLSGIRDIIRSLTFKYPESPKSSIFSMLLGEVALPQFFQTISNLPGEKRFDSKFVFTLLSIKSVRPKDESENPEYCDMSVVTIIEDLLRQDDKSEFVAEDLHLICGYLVSQGLYSEARKIYELFDFYLEAFVVSLLGKIAFIPTLHSWTVHLRTERNHFNNTVDSKNNLSRYLNNVVHNLSATPSFFSSSTIAWSPNNDEAYYSIVSDRSVSTKMSSDVGNTDEASIFFPGYDDNQNASSSTIATIPATPRSTASSINAETPQSVSYRKLQRTPSSVEAPAMSVFRKMKIMPHSSKSYSIKSWFTQARKKQQDTAFFILFYHFYHYIFFFLHCFFFRCVVFVLVFTPFVYSYAFFMSLIFNDNFFIYLFLLEFQAVPLNRLKARKRV